MDLETIPELHVPEVLAHDVIWDRIDPLEDDFNFDPSRDGLADLPYADLAGPGFERLVYELLHSKGENPWFFGRPGDPQYGIDIVAGGSGKQVVYQCKNEQDEPAFSKVKEAVEKFENDWLIHDRHLTPPMRFVYCCPQPLKKIDLVEKWVLYKAEFQNRTGVEVIFWNKDHFDTELRQHPDLVAGLFSDSYATHFCQHRDWEDSPWIRVRYRNIRHPNIKRFLEKHKGNKIFVNQADEDQFNTALDEHSSVAIRGLPGTGKNMLAFELASRLRDPLRRVYYTTLNDGTTGDRIERLWQTLRKRLSLPVIFILDDCHLEPNETGIILERLDPELRNGRLKLVLLIRDQTGGSNDEQDDTPDWLQQMDDLNAVINLRADTTRTRDVTLFLRPDFQGISKQRLERLHHACGGDLLLLDEILKNLSEGHEIDTLNKDTVLPQLRRTYFGAKQHTALPTLKTLTALAQFDLIPQAAFFDGQWRDNEQELAEPLMMQLQSPRRYQFLHSSLAQLVLRALVQADVEAQALEKQVASVTVKAVIDYLRFLSSDPDKGKRNCITVLVQILRSRLQVLDEQAEAQLQANILDSEFVRQVIHDQLGNHDFDVLFLYAIIQMKAQSTSVTYFFDLIEQRFHILFERADTKSDVIGTQTIQQGLYALKKYQPERWENLFAGRGIENFLSCLRENGALHELVSVLQNSSDSQTTVLLDLLTTEDVNRILERTISWKRSIGALNMAMRGLGHKDPDSLLRFEKILGAKNLMRVILANGTLFELFRALQSNTSDFCKKLLNQLNPENAKQLVDKTINSGRSIGTLDFTIRQLGKTSPALLLQLEQAIGAENFIRVILANGTLFELFKALQSNTPDFCKELLDQLNPENAKQLVDKTINSGRSIGIFGLIMRDLGKISPDLLDRLEGIIGTENFTQIILSNGVLSDFFKIFQFFTPSFREKILNLLNPENAKQLVDKTINSGRSIGTLGLTLRELGKNPDTLNRLEQIIGVENFIRVIVANGTLFEFFKVFEYSTRDFRKKLQVHLSSDQFKNLIEKTIRTKRKISQIHRRLQTLSKSSGNPTWFQDFIGVKHFWSLMIACSNLHGLKQTLDSVSASFRQSAIVYSAALSEAEWSQIISQTWLKNTCEFHARCLPEYPQDSQTYFLSALEGIAKPLVTNATWHNLNTTQDFNELPALATAIQERIGAVRIEDLQGLDFNEAINALNCCWRERIDLQPTLASNLKSILPARADWPRKKGESAALRLVLTLARSQEISDEDVTWLLSEISEFLNESILEEMEALPLFLLVWNVAALHFERIGNNSFSTVLSTEQQLMLITMLKKKVSTKHKGLAEERKNNQMALFALTGLLDYCFRKNAVQLLDAIEPFSQEGPELSQRAIQQTFVVAFFALKGIEFQAFQEEVFSLEVRVKLMDALEDYSDVGPAINQLRLHLESIHPPLQTHLDS
jgi:hypothetical protein